ncbi:hypothetical protein IWQ60_006505 [Tieghemiomyces parasiticus]|uniref:Uncharacterized protein n=1 Tax=Tieghemiomyces parasiticus TaxID=78921 RepID=A0A9W8A755_9FUNG|nr:hypothetical protein IWQ60_006505 [Tieghemiomyces parasiticus]
MLRSLALRFPSAAVRPVRVPIRLPRGPLGMRAYSADHSTGPGIARSASEVATRAVCLQLVMARWGMEMALKMGHGDEETKTKALENIAKTSEEPIIAQNLSAKEHELMAKEDGQWDRDDLQCHGHWESLGVLLWMLTNKVDLPPYYEMFSRPLLFNTTGVLPAVPKTIHDFVGNAQHSHARRTPAEVQRAIDVAEAWYWRAHAQRLLTTREELGLDRADHGPSGSGNQSSSQDSFLQASPTMVQAADVAKLPRGFVKLLRGLPDAIARASRLAHEHKLIEAVAEDDFGIDSNALYVNLGVNKNIPLNDDGSPMEYPVNWIPYHRVDASGMYLLTDIAQHRMLAFNWLTGTVQDWDADLTELPSINPVSSLWAPFTEAAREDAKDDGSDRT